MVRCSVFRCLRVAIVQLAYLSVFAASQFVVASAQVVAAAVY